MRFNNIADDRKIKLLSHENKAISYLNLINRVLWYCSVVILFITSLGLIILKCKVGSRL